MVERCHLRLSERFAGGDHRCVDETEPQVNVLHFEFGSTSDAGVVGLGAIVTVQYDGESDSERFLIGHVEERPADAGVSVMSPSSPLGSALLGAKKGATVSYQAPNGKLKVKVLDTRIG